MAINSLPTRPVIISTDPGIDDAVAISLALFSDDIDVKLICPIAGNVDLKKTTYNVQRLLTFLEKEVPVVPGSSSPLLRVSKDASNVHGESGMDGFNFPNPTITPVVTKTAVQAMHETVLTSSTPVTLVGIGPLTDIALYLHLYPQDKERIHEIVLMGGALGRGNFGVLSEFNFGVDPEAAKIVFNSNISIRMAPMEIGRQAKIMPNTSEKIKSLGKIGEMFYSLFAHYRGGSFSKGLNMYDVLALGLILKPEMFEIEPTYVSIETQGTLTGGASLIDLKGYLGKESNAKVATEVDAEQFEKWFTEMVAKTI
ncbi:ribonucleoside hydrolase RihC [Pediococcus acidilactici]|uniref:Ribonucleoside hydrolase RihC n=1 Tax=Pediococcus acidilactici TaxID=1254 RepID=A0AAW8YH78_PEDAC|nr:ribonucleoside hydrolase RihC [Pediococcus acidilactici]MDD9324198.1 ribonucleoside hydrolase RihC [Pediococcus acidilactici]MDV2620937.1 ribonucleoside hydrolase RihC [Pediococcus acidilactici]NBI14675.1 ribonucleoside hydrolase RihC [Pediococcus acidilactici]NFA45147.1 ribonucleoside hydrolase RihC [Pediococcus acidilactici]NFA47026.1 ribonucleoside hydrolase RihC [Pediococcus acidilactici]